MSPDRMQEHLVLIMDLHSTSVVCIILQTSRCMLLAIIPRLTRAQRRHTYNLYVYRYSITSKGDHPRAFCSRAIITSYLHGESSSSLPVSPSRRPHPPLMNPRHSSHSTPQHRRDSQPRFHPLGRDLKSLFAFHIARSENMRFYGKSSTGSLWHL